MLTRVPKKSILRQSGSLLVATETGVEVEISKKRLSWNCNAELYKDSETPVERCVGPSEALPSPVFMGPVYPCGGRGGYASGAIFSW